MKFCQLFDEALVLGCSVDVIVIVDLCCASAQKMLHCEMAAKRLMARDREIDLLIWLAAQAAQRNLVGTRSESRASCGRSKILLTTNFHLLSSKGEPRIKPKL